ncbi:hypothetical protein F2P81_015524 [Scophthalmus maximus]|uniref:EF-hand domain-containing protein n=1 Tax=Scophthalmus maximus TaxID=52904 RepID=A0A6A4SQD2_SCOMX|nr:hypothetical protein F2P81_015524 [Scophthalmus maximus]
MRRKKKCQWTDHRRSAGSMIPVREIWLNRIHEERKNCCLPGPNMPTNTKKKKQRLRKPAKDKRTKKNQVSMEKSCEAFRSNRSEFEGFLDQMTQWFSDHQQQVDQHFSLEDKDQSGSVNLKDFELGLTTLSAPCQQLQLRLLTELLKTNDNNTISYQDLKRQLQRLSSTEVDVSSSKRRDDQLLNPDKDRTTENSCLMSRATL